MKKILSWLLVITMLVGMCPVGAVEPDAPETEPPDLFVMHENMGSLYDAPTDHPKQDAPEISLPTRPKGQSDLSDALIERPESDAQTMEVIEVASGTCGENLTWVLTSDGTLTISGEGAMEDYQWGSGGPWKDYNDNIYHVVVQDGVTRIGNRAFSDIWGRWDTTVYLSNTLVSIGQQAFRGFNSGYSKLIFTLPESLETIEYGAFEDSGIVEINISKNVANIDKNNPFDSHRVVAINVDADNPYYCSKDGVLYTKDMSTLVAYPRAKEDDTLILPDSVSKVMDHAFGILNSDDLKLRNIYIPAGLTNLSAFKFLECIEGFTIAADNPMYCDVDGVIFSKDMKTLVLYPPAKQTVWYKVPNGVEVIGSCAFVECNRLITLELPDGLKKIESIAIQYCSALCNLVIPETVTSLGNHALLQNTSNDAYNIYFMGDAPTAPYYGYSDPPIHHYGNAEWTLYYIEGKEGWTSPTWTTDEYTYQTATFDPETLDLSVAKSGTCGDNLTWEVSRDGVLTISGTGDMQDYTYNERPWSGFYVADFGKSVWKVVIENGVTSIGEYAFGYLESLTTVELADTVTYIGNNAFSSCKSLTSVDIPDSVTWIGNSVFHNCDNLSSVVIGDGVTWIGNSAFNNCDSLSSIEIGGSVTGIGRQAFYSCNSLVSIKIPDGVTAIDEETFYFCRSLTSVEIPNSVKFIDVSAFDACDALTTVYYTGTEEQWNAVYIQKDNDPLLNAEIIFEWSGEEPEEPEIEIPEDAIASGTCGENLIWYLTEDGTLTITGEGEMEDYDNASSIRPWLDYYDSITTVIINNGVTNIGGSAFYNCYNLAKVVIPSSVVNVGYGAFSYCTSLASIELPNSVKSIGEYAFSYCTGLTSLVIPDGVTSINNSTFDGCSNLVEITIPVSVTSIGDYVFNGCNALNTVYFLGTEKQWNAVYIAEGNDPLLDADIIVINDETGEPVVPGDAIASGTCGENLIWFLTEDGALVISGKGEMENYSAGAAPWYSYIDSIIRIVIHDGVTSIGEYAFHQCSELERITIPVSMTAIGYASFNSCRKMKNVDYSGTREQWDKITIDPKKNLFLTWATIRCTDTVFPSGYDFFNDSYNFENPTCEIILKGYFTTIFEPGPGAKLYSRWATGGEEGLCFGMAYTTAAIYQGYPDCSAISTRNDTQLEPVMCKNIRDILNFESSYLLLGLGFSSELTIGEHQITIDDYIKYSFIYQLGSEVARAKKETKNKIWDLYNAVKKAIDNGELSVTIGITYYEKWWIADSSHAVLAVGYEGNDILIDDPNNIHHLERLTINEDGTWEYSGSWKSNVIMDNTNTDIYYLVDVLRPYQILQTGKKADTANTGFTLLGDTTTQETYIENMERLDADNMLLYIEDVENVLLPENTVEIIDDIGTGDSDADTEYPGNLYWVENTESVLVSGLNGEQNSIMIANDDTVISIDADALTEISGTINETSQTIEVTTAGESECSVSYLTVTSEKDVELHISGTASEDGISIQNSEDGLVVEGFSSGTIELLYDDEVQESIEFSDEDQSFTVSYDKMGENPAVDVTADETDEETEDVLLGDVNGDGKVNGTDTNLIFRYVSGTTEFTDEQCKAADVNGDGKVNGTDTNLVFRFVSGTLDILG